MSLPGYNNGIFSSQAMHLNVPNDLFISAVKLDSQQYITFSLWQWHQDYMLEEPTLIKARAFKIYNILHTDVVLNLPMFHCIPLFCLVRNGFPCKKTCEQQTNTLSQTKLLYHQSTKCIRCWLIFELILLLVDIVYWGWYWSLFRINTYEMASWIWQF